MEDKIKNKKILKSNSSNLVSFKIESDLSFSTKIIETIEESTNSGYWLWSLNDNSIKLSDNFYKILGLKVGEITGYDDLNELLVPEDRFQVTQSFYNSFSQRKELIQNCTISNNNIKKTIKVYGKPIYNENAQLTSYLGTIQEVIDLNVQESKIEQQKRIIRFITFLSEKLIKTNIYNLVETLELGFEKISDDFGFHKALIINFDLETEDKVLVQWKQQNFHKYYDVKIKNDLIKDLRKYLLTKSEVPLDQSIIQINDYNAISEEFKSLREYYKTQRIKSLLIVPLISPFEFIGYTFFINFTDSSALTDLPYSLILTLNRMTVAALVRSKYEEILIKAKDEAENANIAKSAFLANINHEIRTPLNSILGYTNILKDTNEHLKNNLYLEGIINSSNILMELLTNIIEISKIQSGKYKLNSDKISIQGLLNEVNSIYFDKATKKGLTFETVIPSNLPAFIISDEQKLWQILNNILENAIKFTEKGNVKFSIISENKKNNLIDINFIIEDTGTGIDEAYLESIFNTFKQADDNLNRKYGGSGLGLSISKSLVELLNGSIEVESKKNVGSKFTILLKDVETPIINENVELKVYDSNLKSVDDDNLVKAFGGKVFLIVDDDRPNLIIIKKILEPYNIEFITASNGEEAIERYKENDIDFVILDYSMPKLNGVDAARIIRDELSDGFVNILILSGYSKYNEIDGLDGVEFPLISKPIEFDSFKYKIYNLLQNEQIKAVKRKGEKNKNVIDNKFLRDFIKNEFEIAFSTLNIDDIKKLIKKGLDFANNYPIIEVYLDDLFDLQQAVNVFNVNSIINLMKEFKRKYLL